MRLSEIAAQPVLQEVQITGLSCDSRTVEPGGLFAALSGSKLDGAKFVPAALSRGAAALLLHPQVRSSLQTPAAIIADTNPRSRLAQMAARFFAAVPRVAVAVTGTNGKTSVANFTRQIWAHAGLAAASLGTVGAVTPQGHLAMDHTTPDPIVLHSMLSRIAGQGVSHVALEASSHGLDQNRLDGLRLEVAAFTNLTRDHLDYHKTLEAYRWAKFRLFGDVLPPGGTAVLNGDIEDAVALRALARARGQSVLQVGMAKGCDLWLKSRMATAHGQDLILGWLGRDYSVHLPLAGSFQASNVLIAAGMALASGVRIDAAIEALGRLNGAPGRLERVAMAPNGAAIYVDYAHTPDAISTVIAALRPHCSGQLWIIFGCGGDRDPGKRPLMGAAASAADQIIVTDDNPRSEDAGLIRKAALAGAPPSAREIADRAEAIHSVIAELGHADILIIAGKGHETGQTIGSVTRHFNDAEEARGAVRALGGPS